MRGHGKLESLNDFSGDHAMRYNALQNATLILALAALLCGTTARATPYTWIGPATGNQNWSTATNWSPQGVPNVADSVFFAVADSNNSVIDANFTVTSITIQAGYTGTLTLTNGVSLTVVSTLSIAGGTFNASGVLSVVGAVTLSGGTLNLNGSTTNSGSFAQTGGTFTAPATLRVFGNWSHTGGTFSHN